MQTNNIFRKRTAAMAGPGEVLRRTGSLQECEGLRGELEESLRHLMANPAERPELRLTCDRVIRTCIQRLGEEEEEGKKTCEGHLGTLLRLAELACDGYQACAPSPSPRQQLYLERLLFHLLKGAAARGALEFCPALAERLRRGLELCRGEGGPSPRDVEAVAKNGLAVLWKGAEAAGEGGRRLALTLRLRGLRLLALAEEPGAPSSSLPRKFGQAIALYLKGAPSPVGDEDSAHLRREFEALLSGAGGSACELALHFCGALCRGGRPDVALEALSRRRGPPAEGAHASAAFTLCRLACGLSTRAGGDSAPSLAEAGRTLRSLPPGDPRQRKVVADACQFLLSALDGAQLSLEGLLRLFDLLDTHFTALCQRDKEASMATLKQSFQNLEVFSRRVYDFLLESQGKRLTGAEQLLPPCKRAMTKMVEFEEALLAQGLTDYVGATALRLYNLAYGFYTQQLYSEAAEVAAMFRGAEQPPNLFSRSSLPQDRVSRYFKLLVECHRKEGRLDLALESVGLWLMALADRSAEQVTEPIALWVCVKADAVKSGNEELQLRTLKDTLEPWGLEPRHLTELLTEELRAYKRLRTDTSQERFNVICDLLKLCEEGPGGTQHLRALQLLELAQLLCYRDLSRYAECSAMDCVEEAMSLLDSVPETPGNHHQLLDDRAHAFLWHYICAVETRMRASMEGGRSTGVVLDVVAELDDGATNDLDYEDKQQGALSVHDCIDFNLTAETHRNRGLDKALSLWKSLLSETAAPRLRSTEQTLHALHLTASLYGLMDKPFQVIESYGLTLRLLEAEKSDPLSVAFALLHLGETLLLVDCLDQAEVCLDEAEMLLKGPDPGRGDQLLMKTTLSFLRSRLLCARHQVPAGLALLLDVLACPALQKPSKVWYLLKAKVQQLVACYLSLPPAALPLPLRRSLQEQGWSSPEAALTDSHKLLCGIVMLMCPGVLTFGKSSPELRCPGTAGDSLFQKWLVLTNLLTCSQSLVSLLTAVGSTQEAKMFCLESLRLTAKLQCVRPCAGFLVANAELELLRGDRVACDLDLQQVLMMLESTADFTSESGRTMGGRRIEPRKGRLAESWSGEGEGPADEPPSFLRVRPLSRVEVMASGQASPSAQASSPVLKPRPPGLPAPLRHPTGCSCPLCSDLALCSTCLRWGLIRGRLEEGGGGLAEEVRVRCRELGAAFACRLRERAAWVLGRPGGGVSSPGELGRPGGGGSSPGALGRPGGGVSSPETPPLLLMGPLRGIEARAYALSARMELEAGLEWLRGRGPGLWELEGSRAALLLAEAARLLGRRREAARQKAAPPPCRTAGRAVRRQRAGGREASLRTPGRSATTSRRQDARPARGQAFEVLEEEGSPPPLPQVRVSARVRTRLRKRFDDSEVEEEEEEEAPAAARGLRKPRPARTKRAGARTARQQQGEEGGGERQTAERTGEAAIEVCLPSDTDTREEDADLDAVYSCLSLACSAIRHCPPSTLYPQACQQLALCLASRQPYTTAYLLSQSVAVTARHQMLQSLHRKSQKVKKEQSHDVTERLQGLNLHGEPKLQPQYLAELDTLFQFSVTEPECWPLEEAESFKGQLEQIPDGVVVCLLTLASISPKSDPGEILLLSRLQKGRMPVTVQIPAEQNEVSVSSLLGRFDAILEEQKEVSNRTELRAWWDGRSALDQRMKELVESLETDVLGCWKGLLLPGLLDPQVESEVASLCRRLLAPGECEGVKGELMKAALSGSHLLSRSDVQALADGLCRPWAKEAGPLLEAAVQRLKTRTSQSPSAQTSQLVLILDKHLQRLPWESMPSLRPHRVSRLPSFQFLLAYVATGKHQLKSVLTEGVDSSSVFYVLNPQGNLPNTEKTFKDWFRRKRGWEGVVGRGPTEEQLRSVLCNRDLYLYAGHGAGVRFLEGQEVQKLSCRAASLLVGCSSAALALRGDLEGAGIVLKYMMAGCPLFLGNLWDVTDKDIDRYMEHLLRKWLEAGTQASILDYVSRARQAPKLKYLIGASPVVYGLSVSLQ